MHLSENFTLEEMLRSSTAIRRGFKEQFNPPLGVIENLKALAVNILQPVRESIDAVITVTSGYRCKRLNTDRRGAKNSQHLTGEAADLECFDNGLLFDAIRENKLPFDQLIWEYGDDNKPAWVHVSYGPRNRREILRVKLVNGEKVTEKWK